VHLNGNHTPMNEMRIDYDGIWQRQHWQSIRSAYGNSPFFDFYADYFSPFYEKKIWEKLTDYNSELIKLSLKLLKMNSKIELTSEYFRSFENCADYRELISPKKTIEDDPEFIPKRYVQVFEERHGFIPNLSIIDLLCCNGPVSREILSV
ncbi:MAG TPA: WbqC family protein, partial [Bacteroidia bacterium]|nr:WbqC family protein [Bacteroidia bacterium]